MVDIDIVHAGWDRPIWSDRLNILHTEDMTPVERQ